MFSSNVNFKGHMIVAFMTALIRTTAMALADIPDRDLTYWKMWWTWGVASLLAEGLFLAARHILKTKETGVITLASDELDAKAKAVKGDGDV